MPRVQILLPLPNFTQAGRPVFADIAQSAEHILGKDEVTRSNRVISSINVTALQTKFVKQFLFA